MLSEPAFLPQNVAKARVVQRYFGKPRPHQGALPSRLAPCPLLRRCEMVFEEPSRARSAAAALERDSSSVDRVWRGLLRAAWQQSSRTTDILYTRTWRRTTSASPAADDTARSAA